MIVVGPQRGLFLTCLATGVGCLLVLDLYFAPAAIAEAEAPSAVATGTTMTPAGGVGAPSGSGSAPPPASAPTVRAALDPAARVPTIVARFESKATEPADEAAIRALATAMIEAHDAKIVLEGHSDMRGGDDYNHEISLQRAGWVKARLVALGVSADRVETVGLGATRPLRYDAPDAASVNRRVEVRWVGR